MRKRFKMSRIASSDNYELSRNVPPKISRGEHRSEISSTLVIKEQKYIREVNSCFRRRIENT